ncbi:MAG: hypothetical protein GX559_00725 [Candidatus Pacebacteria bacterium]|nr:hypothetical protein [Candidatus Paceibacterota bacterium]
MSKISSRPMSGQIGIIVVLITAAALTFGLSVANRVVQENKVVVDRSDSIRTFNTAETGVDTALNKIFQYESGSIPLPVGNVVDDDLNKVSIAQSNSYEGHINQGESLQIDLTGIGGNITINWSKTACSSTHKIGLLITLLHRSGSEYQSNYYLLAHSDCLHSSQQNFIGATATGGTFKYSYNFSLPASADASLLIQPLGAATDINITNAPGLIANTQYEIESRATSDSENAVSNKTIKVSKSVPSAPGFMSFALFSGGNIVK